MKPRFIIIFCIFLLAAGCAKQNSAPLIPSSGYNRSLTVSGQNLMVEIVSDEKKMQTGLSGRSSMAQNNGMLFEFGSSSSGNFWMKDMKLNLDLIWISQNKIIGITADVPAPGSDVADDKLTLYPPPSPVDMVLEVNAGWSKSHGIKVGDEIRLK